MDISDSMKVTVPENVMFRDLEGEAVLLNLDNENYYGLDSVGTRMWNVLSSTGSIQEAYDVLITEYDAEPEVLRKDLLELVKDLETQGLINLSDA